MGEGLHTNEGSNEPVTVAQRLASVRDAGLATVKFVPRGVVMALAGLCYGFGMLCDYLAKKVTPPKAAKGDASAAGPAAKGAPAAHH